MVYVDIETTGANYRSGRIIEFAAIRVENNKVVETFNTLINPGSPIPFHITGITGIKNTDVVNAPLFEEVAERIASILWGAILIAHNVRFDYSFLKRQLEICNISFAPKMLCSVRMSRALYSAERSHSLESIIRRFNIDCANRHRAYDDALAVKKFLGIAYEEHGLEVFDSAVNKQLKSLSTPPHLDSSMLDNIPNTPGVYTFKDKRGVPIYIGKSVTLQRRIKSHFSQDTRVDKEMKLSLQTHQVSYIETANELEALLLESKMIKEQLPLYNRLLRKVKKMYIARLDNIGDYKTVNITYNDPEDFLLDKNIYGVYASRMKAKAALSRIQKEYSLCPKILGLEKSSGHCFKYQLGKCLGACGMRESAAEYNERFEHAFASSKLKDWPYDSPIALTHVTGSSDKALVIDKWNIIGELVHKEGCDADFRPWKNLFDLDTYKIIQSYIFRNSSLIQLKPVPRGLLESITA